MCSMTILTLFITAILALLGLPIAVCLGFSSFLVIFIFDLSPLAVIPGMIFSGFESFILVAVPFFVLAGVLMESGDIARRLVNFSNSLTGWSIGGLAAANIVVSFIFGGISGSSLSDTAAIGTIMIPEMERNGYDKEYSAAITLISSTLAVVVPPSILMVILGVTVEQSIGKLLIGGIIPGVIMTLSMLIQNYYISKKRNYGTYCKFSTKNIINKFKEGYVALGTPLIIIVCIMFGFVTPTEAAGLAVVYTLFIGIFIYKKINFKTFVNATYTTAKYTSVILFLSATSRLFTFIMVMEQAPQRVGAALIGITDNRILFMLLIELILLFVGMLVDAVIAILVLAPILFPVAISIGIDPVHFGVVFVMALAIGLVTPPFGVCLFNVCNVADIKLETLVKASLPLYFSLVLALTIVTIFPQFVIFLPNLFMK